jgi:succinoglycan biosynthesis protein ExoM
LTRLLGRLNDVVARVDGVDVALVVVDDDPQRSAAPVFDAFACRYPAGASYDCSGHGNIALTRNLALEHGIKLGDWVALIDDDCVPGETWLAELLRVQAAMGADAVTGRCVDEAPAGAHRWLQVYCSPSDRPGPFGSVSFRADGDRSQYGATKNVLISSQWLAEHPDVRFREPLGVLGGEDAVFFIEALRAGLKLHYAAHAVVTEAIPQPRATFRAQLRRQFWLGNSEYVSNRFTREAPPARLMLRGLRRIAKSAVAMGTATFHRDRARAAVEVLFILNGLGMASGPVGLRVRHH